MNQKEIEQGAEIRFYLERIKEVMAEPTEDEDREPFKPQVIVTATRLPSGAVEVTTNFAEIPAKIAYILDAYDDTMHLKTNTSVKLENVLIV